MKINIGSLEKQQQQQKALKKNIPTVHSKFTNKILIIVSEVQITCYVDFFKIIKTGIATS